MSERSVIPFIDQAARTHRASQSTLLTTFSPKLSMKPAPQERGICLMILLPGRSRSILGWTHMASLAGMDGGPRWGLSGPFGCISASPALLLLTCISHTFSWNVCIPHPDFCIFTGLGMKCLSCSSCAANYSIYKELLHIQVIPLAPCSALFFLHSVIRWFLPSQSQISHPISKTALIKTVLDLASTTTSHLVQLLFNSMGILNKVWVVLPGTGSNVSSCNCWNSYCN